MLLRIIASSVRLTHRNLSLLELIVDCVGYRDVLKHALQLRGELTSALRLQFRDHRLLRILRDTLLQQ